MYISVFLEHFFLFSCICRMPYTFGLLAIFKKFIISFGLDTALGVANAKAEITFYLLSSLGNDSLLFLDPVNSIGRNGCC